MTGETAWCCKMSVMRISMSLFRSVLLLACGWLFAAAAYGANNIMVVVDGNYLQLDQPPVMEGGSVLVPLRGIFEKVGAQVLWDARTKTIRATKPDGAHVQLTLDSREALVNGRPVRLDMPAHQILGTTMVPLRFVSEA